ncbi:MAG: hypothetical protein AAGA30_13870 [Planctomycetota bacterium]
MLIRFKAIASISFLALVPLVVYGQAPRGFDNVPPTMEIEVLDPGVDPNGNPAVLVEHNIVEIPPAILVHRYYYSGDRTFQGPMFPGGPSILVFNHPRSGERMYVPATMLPGAPRVTYTKKGITYEFNKQTIELFFGFNGAPKIRYISGNTLRQKVKTGLQLEAASKQIDRFKLNSKNGLIRFKTSVKGVGADIAKVSKVVTLPVQHVVRLLPMGAQLTSGETGLYLAERAAQFEEKIGAYRFERQARLERLDSATNR